MEEYWLSLSTLLGDAHHMSDNVGEHFLADWDALERRPSSGTLTCVNSSAEATTHITQRLPGVAVSAKATPLTFQHANEVS